ncbi:hypothetical protein RhiirA5_384621 [Rhizophagus irregularis]|uniref:Uncharacterized protein n=1 Tax=Rhizophagus irregularis TaxID=588596 RepID=A0A2N0NSF1_9GLOM|nr:hypothetical protein RhiirA5_384621 [Rhizophagus irregularis]
MGWNDNNILEILKQDIEYTPVTVNVGNYKIFVYNIGISSREKWCYAGYEFNDRELSAWQSMLNAVGATNITPWSREESQHQLWTKSPNGQADKAAFSTLYKRGFLTSIPKNMPNATRTFWTCFKQALANNKKGPDGKQRVLSIIANEFTYEELKQNLNVGQHTILESRKHARSIGYGAPTRKPIKYLQDTKKALWQRFSEEYPNGMCRTSFMMCLEGGQYVYRENLGGLCSTCNDCGYMVFEVMISAHITDELLKKRLLVKSQELRRYIRRQYSKEMEVTSNGIAVHNSCISHCIRHAFGACDLDHPVTCTKCESLFIFFEELKAAIGEQYSETLDEYQRKLIAWMAHHARKTYLNIHVRTNLEELDEEGAVIIVDYKMKILPQSSRETKTEFFGKRELMLIIGQWKEWYNIIPRKWVFLEAGEAKTAIDSHHAQISQAIKRYVKLGYDVNGGNDIEFAIKDIAGAHIANLNPNHDNDKAKLGTITGISNLQEWTWPTDEEKVGYIYACALPGIGEWKEWSLEKIEKIVKKQIIEKPNPTFTPHTQSTKQWTMSVSIDLTNLENVNNRTTETKSQLIFTSGWALKEKEKTHQRDPMKRMSPQVKHLLESMFHTGTANFRQKLTAQQMQEELLRRAELGEIEENDVPKVSTITNWISTFSCKWKEAMTLRSLEENEN